MLALHNIMLALEPVVDIDVNKGGGRAWYGNPLYIGIGVIILLMIVLISVMAARKA